MSYNSIVLVKQVPDTANISGQVMKPDGTVNRAMLPAIFNPEDKTALELALQIKDRYGGKVSAITMGPPKASEVLRDCLYMGADEVFLISDRKFAGADTLATSYVLSEAIKSIGKFDLIFADPPYRWNHYIELLPLAFLPENLSEYGILVLESEIKHFIEWETNIYEVFRQKKADRSLITFFGRKNVV